MTMIGEVDFAQAAEACRRELLAFGYRMLGSTHDAEDAIQETYLRAWRAYPRFDGRSSLRTWLYRIATNVCLHHLETVGRRALPTGLGPAGDEPRESEVAWLEPFPTPDVDPAQVVDLRAGMRLALVAALQVLPARQRAVLILRDVLRWRAVEVAEVLQISKVAVNSLLQRARRQLEAAGLTEDDVQEPDDEGTRILLDQYAEAFERADVAALTGLLSKDAIWEMPPLTEWYAGREVIGAFLAERIHRPGDGHMVPIRANHQPGFGLYLRDGVGWRAHALHVVTVRRGVIARVVSFHGSGAFALFGLPQAFVVSLRDCLEDPYRSA